MSGDNEGLHRDLAAGAGRRSARPSADLSGFGQSARPPSIRPGSGVPGAPGVTGVTGVTGGSSPDNLSPGSGAGPSGGLTGGLTGGLFGGGLSDAPAKPARPPRAARLAPGASQATGARSGAQPGGAQPDASAQVAAVRARRAEREKAEAEAARQRAEVRAAAEDAREERRVAALKRLAAGRKAAGGAAPAARAAASPRTRDKAGPAPLVPQGATVDARIRSLMRDPRYWRDRDEGLQNHVLRQWARAYPGTSVHAGFSRPDPIPAIEPDAVEPWPPEAKPLPAPHRDGPLHPRPAVINPEFVWNAETGRWERDPAHRPGRGSPSAPAPQPLTAAAPSDADAPGPDSTLGPNSGQTREEALAALRERARETGMDYGAYLQAQHRIRQAFPDEGGADASDPDGVQVAAAPGAALPWLIGALGLGAGIGVLPGPEIPDGDGDADAPTSPPPSAPSAGDVDGAAPGFPADAGGLQDGPPAAGDPPAGFDSPPASPDQSGDLPQGTLLPSRDDLFGKGPTFDKIRKAIDAFHANAKPGDLDPPGAAPGGRLAPAQSPVLNAIRQNGGEAYGNHKGAYIVRGQNEIESRIYVYDWGGGGRHQPEIEVFNGKGKHLGALHPVSGVQIKGPVTGRTISAAPPGDDPAVGFA